MNKWEYAKQNKLSMSELGQRGGRVSGSKRRKAKRLREEAEKLQERGGDWWNK